MRRFQTFTALALMVTILGCGDGDDDDKTGFSKTPLPMDQVPAEVLKAAQTSQPDLTFFAAYKDKFQGQDSIELKGKTKSGKIKEVEVSPQGKVLGTE